jgi:hypothetical protein
VIGLGTQLGSIHQDDSRKTGLSEAMIDWQGEEEETES